LTISPELLLHHRGVRIVPMTDEQFKERFEELEEAIKEYERQITA
jgi:hypothetical protein